MVWIREAQDQAREKAERLAQLEADRAVFKAEPEPTPETAAIFLQALKGPIMSVAADLEAAGYVVEQGMPGYLYDREVRSSHVKPSDLGKFAIARNKSTWGGMHDEVEHPEIEVFGISFGIKRDDKFLGSIRMYPMSTERHRLGAVHYITGAQTYGEPPTLIATSDEGEDVVLQKLQGIVASWIKQDSLQPTPAAS